MYISLLAVGAQTFWLVASVELKTLNVLVDLDELVAAAGNPRVCFFSFSSLVLRVQYGDVLEI